MVRADGTEYGSVVLSTVVQLVRNGKLAGDGHRPDGQESGSLRHRLVECENDGVDVVDVADAQHHVVSIQSDPHPPRLARQSSLQRRPCVCSHQTIATAASFVWQCDHDSRK